MKRIITLLLAAVLCFALVGAGFASGEKADDANARSLQELGLFIGVGENADGSVDFDLDRAPTRVEALVMLIRVLGKDAEASAYEKSHPFTDVPSWADGYVSYAYDNGLVLGLDETHMDALSDATAENYLTFMLRALGYADGENGQFIWSSPFGLARYVGIVPDGVESGALTRAQAVDITCAALFAPLNGENAALHERLERGGVFTAEEFAAVFGENPFAELAVNGFTQLSTRTFDSYAEAESLVMGTLSQVTKRVELDCCTVITGELTGVMTPSSFIFVIFKSGGAMPENTVVWLPRAVRNISGGALTTDALEVDTENAVLTYSYTLDEPLYKDGRLVRESGTYRFSYSLETAVLSVAVR